MEGKWESPNDLSFLYKLCLPVMNRTQITTWVQVPEFVDEIRRIKSEKADLKELVEVSDILSVMKAVFERLSKEYTPEELKRILPVTLARNSINRLERSISVNPQKSRSESH